MSTPRPGTPGATRTCPHCRNIILESAVVCPGCRGHLRYADSGATAAATRITPLRVESTIKAPDGGAFEYSMVLSIRNERGEEINRHIVGVGAMHPGEERTFSLAVEACEVVGYRGKGRAKH